MTMAPLQNDLQQPLRGETSSMSSMSRGPDQSPDSDSARQILQTSV
jgi:hypothetical protein